MACFVLAAVFSRFLYANKIWLSVCVCEAAHARTSVVGVGVCVRIANYSSYLRSSEEGREKPLSGNLHECRAEQEKAERGRGIVLIAQKNNVACAQPVITSGCTHALTRSLALWLRVSVSVSVFMNALATRSRN